MKGRQAAFDAADAPPAGRFRSYRSDDDRGERLLSIRPIIDDGADP
jgi:hypothetical protein